jgi:hypothetical protein
MTRKAWLAGHQFHLEALAERLQHGDSTIQREGNEYYLTSVEIDAAPDNAHANEIAAKIIRRINALGRTHDPNFRPVNLSRYTDDTGRSHVFGAMAATVATIRIQAAGTVTRPDGTVAPNPPSPWPDYLALADKDPVVAEALEIIARAETLGWDDLREAVKPDTIITLGWTNAADLESFKESANHPDVSGDEARHARRPNRPQHRQMPITEGRSYISDLLARWLERLK